MNATLTLDTAQFDEAMVQYAAATHKTMAESANRFLNNVAIKGLDVARRAQASDIDALRGRSWWIKFLAKIAGAQLLAKDTARFTKRQAKVADRRARGLRAKDAKFTRTRGTRDQWYGRMRKAEKAILKTRTSHINFLRMFFLRMSEEIRKRTGVGSVERLPARADGGFTLRFREATEADPSAYIAVVYDYRKRSAETASRTEGLLQPALTEAADAALADVTAYAERRMIDDAAARMATGRV